ncbi:MAG: Adenine specific methylase [Labilithrix sp.]|nr:Adenine specific methylase [Labilithrix sp.]
MAPAARVRTPRGVRPQDEGVRLVWPGRRWRMDATEDDRAVEGNRPRSENERGLRPFDLTGDGAHRLVHGDVLDLTSSLACDGLSGKVDLVYVDPPYASDRDYVAESRLDGPADGRIVRSPAYEDTWTSRPGGLGTYLDMLAPRLEALAGLLGPRGTIWVHLDWRAAYLVRSILDEVLGRDAFLNEIVWRRAPNLGRQATSGQFGRTLDTLVVYGKPDATLTPPTRLEPIEESSIRWDEQGRPFTSAPRGDYTDASIAKLDLEGRVHRTASGRVYIKYFLVKDGDGVWCRERRVDALWTDVPPLRHAAASERTGYPTQKPRALLERIITCATPPGGLVVDAFAGSGTTAVAAHALGRRAVVSDRSPVAIATARARLLREGAGVRIERAAGTVAAPETNVTVRSEPGDTRDALRVTLVEPSEPMAWAIGTMKDDVFTCGWHAERTLGAKAVAAQREAVVPRAGAEVVRVWGDDGSVTTRPVASALR